MCKEYQKIFVMIVNMQGRTTGKENEQIVNQKIYAWESKRARRQIENLERHGQTKIDKDLKRDREREEEQF